MGIGCAEERSASFADNRLSRLMRLLSSAHPINAHLIELNNTEFAFAGMQVFPFTSGNVDYLTKYRLYKPGFGRWLSRDPIEEQGGINLYGYVGGNPVNNTDRLGLSDDDNVIPFPPKKDGKLPKCETLTCEQGYQLLVYLRNTIVISHQDGLYNDIEYQAAKNAFNKRLIAFTGECPEYGSQINLL
jgi:RHS repeat-associated protein